MYFSLRAAVPNRSRARRRLVFWLLAALVTPGCHKEPETDYTAHQSRRP